MRRNRVRAGLAPALVPLHGDVGRAAVGFFGIDQDVDAGGQAGCKGAFEGRANVLRPFDQFAMAAQGFDHFIVANAGREFGGGGVADDCALRVFDLAPGSVVANDGDDGQFLAHHALKLHAVEAKRAVAVQDQHPFAGASNLCGHGEACAGAQAAHRAGIEPVARLIDVDDSASVADDIAAIAYNGGLFVDEVAYLAAEAHGVYWHGIGAHQVLVAFLCFALLASNMGQPVACRELPGGAGQLAHAQANITHQRGGGSPVDADILARQVEPDHVGLLPG